VVKALINIKMLFSKTVLIKHLWQLEAVVLLHAVLYVSYEENEVL
jgi:hypothetical protein